MALFKGRGQVSFRHAEGRGHGFYGQLVLSPVGGPGLHLYPVGGRPEQGFVPFALGSRSGADQKAGLFQDSHMVIQGPGRTVPLAGPCR